MWTRQSTANITHHDATHTFFIYMTTKTALKRTETKTKYCDSLEIFLVLTPRFYFLLFAIAWHSPRILGIIVQLFPEIFIHNIQQVHCCFFFFLSRLLPFATPWNGLNNAHVFWSSPFRYCEWIYWFLLFTLECLSNTNKFNNIG